MATTLTLYSGNNSATGLPPGGSGWTALGVITGGTVQVTGTASATPPPTTFNNAGQFILRSSCPISLTAASYTAQLLVAASPLFSPGGGQAQAHYWNGTLWVPIDSAVSFLPSVATSNGGTITAATTQFIRVTISGGAVGFGAWSIDYILSSLSITYTELAPTNAPVLNIQGACEGAQNTLSWSAASCADSYDIERDGTVIATSHPTLVYVDAPVTIGTTYTYRVRGKNSAGPGPWSTGQAFTPCAAAGPPTATTTAIVKEKCEGRQATIWFTAPVSGATGYRIRLYGPGLPTTGQIIYDGAYLPSESGGFIYRPLQYARYELTVQGYNGLGSSAEGTRYPFMPCEDGCECSTWVGQECR